MMLSRRPDDKHPARLGRLLSSDSHMSGAIPTLRPLWRYQRYGPEVASPLSQLKVSFAEGHAGSDMGKKGLARLDKSLVRCCRQCSARGGRLPGLGSAVETVDMRAALAPVVDGLFPPPLALGWAELGLMVCCACPAPASSPAPHETAGSPGGCCDAGPGFCACLLRYWSWWCQVRRAAAPCLSSASKSASAVPCRGLVLQVPSN